MPSPSASPLTASPALSRTAVLMPALLLFISGAAALIYQVLWIKQLSLVIGVEVYAITTGISAFFAALVWLPRPLLFAVAIALIGGHNLLDGLHFAPGSLLQNGWAILHERSWIDVGDSLRLRITYPVLPWIGVIALGYGLGPWFANGVQPALRQRYLALAVR